MESYVLRIYRRDAEDSGGLVGIIESVKDGQQRRFSSMQELWEILTADDINKPSGKAGRGRKPKDL